MGVSTSADKDTPQEMHIVFLFLIDQISPNYFNFVSFEFTDIDMHENQYEIYKKKYLVTLIAEGYYTLI